MFCGKCGTENDKGNMFCKKCGQPLPKEENEIPKMVQGSKVSSAIGAGEDIAKKAKEETDKVANKVKSMPKKTLGIIGAVAIVFLIFIVSAVNGANTINLNKYLKLESTGFDGYGRVNATIDWKAIEEKYGSKIKFKSSAKNEYGGLMTLMTTPIGAIETSTGVSISENGNLSNGDEVSYTFSVADDLSKYVNCKVKYKDGKYKVSGLTEVGTFDAFQDLTVEYSGTAPDGRANLNYLGSELNSYDFKCDKSSGLSNGDTVTVTIDSSKVEYCAKNLGKVPVTTEKSYKVENLESYLKKLDEIDDESLAMMQSQASDVFNAYVAKDFTEGETLESFTYIGDYLLTSKKNNGQNYLYLVYKAQVHNNYANEQTMYDKINDVYWCIRFDGIKIGSDGKAILDVTNYRTPDKRFTIDTGVNSGWGNTAKFNYYGYGTLADLYKDAVTQNVDSCNHEDNVDESLAPKTVNTGSGLVTLETPGSEEAETLGSGEAETSA